MAGLPLMTIPADECCLGLESNPWAFVAHIVAVFREVRRVLRNDGTLWLNLGDSYSTESKWGGSTGGKAAAGLHGASGGGREKARHGIPDKNLLGIPWRAALALQADGWYLRQDIIWAKPNCMPESATDRCTKAHEYLFLLSKSPRYHFDAEAIKEPANLTGKGNANGFRGGAYVNNATFDNAAGGTRTSTGNDSRSRRDSFKRDGSKREQAIHGQSAGTHRPDREESAYPLDVRNKRSVWTVATQPFREAHFATFPPALIEPCILAGCPDGGTVLDPFGGAGTTGLVADRLQRDAILIELNPEYADLSGRRITGDAPLLTRMEPAA